MSRSPQQLRVLVAGAGPVGLLFAWRLARRARNITIRVVDAGSPHAWRKDAVDSRIYALSRSSQHHLAELWGELASRRVSPYRRMRVFEGDSPTGELSVCFDSADIGEPDLGHIVEDSLLRTVLLEQLLATGVEIRFETAVETLQQVDRGVTLQLSDGSEWKADLVIGADGAASRIREVAAIEAVGRDYEQRAIVTHIETDQPHAETAWQRFLPGGPLAFLPLADGRCSVVWTNARDEAERLLGLSDEDFCEAIEAASAQMLGRVLGASPRFAFPLEVRHATQYVRQGIALIGDAAHVVHPLAGQGMNLGFEDAATLAETILDAVDAGEYPADEYVLRRYARARRAANLGMQLAFDGINEGFRQPLPDWAVAVRRIGMSAVGKSGFVRQELMRRALGLDRT